MINTLENINSTIHKFKWELEKIDNIDNFNWDILHNFYFTKLQTSLYFSNIIKLIVLKESNLSKKIENNFSFLFVWTNSNRKVSKSLERAKLALLRDIPIYLDKILKVINKEFESKRVREF